MTTPAVHEDPEIDGPRFDRRRLDPVRVAQVLEVTTSLCAVNNELGVRLRRKRFDRWSSPPPEPEELTGRRRVLLDELHRLIAT